VPAPFEPLGLAKDFDCVALPVRAFPVNLPFATDSHVSVNFHHISLTSLRRIRSKSNKKDYPLPNRLYESQSEEGVTLLVRRCRLSRDGK
jgi:hypothetical protein